jgi:phosphoglycolate phosphatase-like HAD superfamily hydrolase
MNDLNKIKKYKRIIYDFDGTIAKILIDWKDWHTEVEKIYKEYDKNFTHHGYMHGHYNHMIERFGDDLRDKLLKLNNEYELSYFKGTINNNELIEFIKENIKENIKDKEIKQYVLTSNGKDIINKLLKDLDLENIFEKVVTRDTAKYIKPSTSGIEQIVDIKNKDEYIMVGDTDADEKVAKAMDIDFEKIEICPAP